MLIHDRSENRNKKKGKIAYRRVGRKPCCFSAGRNAVLLDEWPIFKGVSGSLLKAKSLRILGETHP
jgi:hypothetical protein